MARFGCGRLNWAKYKKGRWKRRIMFGLLAAGCGRRWARILIRPADNAHADYSNLNPGSDFDSQWKKVENGSDNA